VKHKEIKAKSVAELEKELGEMKDEQFRLKFKKTIGQLEQTANLKKTKQNIARIKTVLRQKELEGKKV
jgi:large subunit ribosomal protein L29